MKTAILVISFGTSHRDTLEKTIGAVEKKLKYEFKTDVFRAFTSGMIIKKLRERDGIEIDTVDEALKKLYKSGYTDIFCVPTHIMCGIEYDKACRMIEKFNDNMKIRISRPLVTETSDYYNIVDIFKHRLTDKNRLYVFMGHGSDHFANAAYPALDYHFKNADMNNVFVGTVEGFPDLETVISHAMKTDIKNVTLLPFMLVCGDHAKNDMAVEWKEEFENNGFNVCLLYTSMHLLRDICENEGTTIIMSTHDIDVVPIYSDYVYVINHGKLLTDGTPEEVFSNPTLLREHNLRLPRIAHLLEILNKCDKLNVDFSKATIGKAREEILNLIRGK